MSSGSGAVIADWALPPNGKPPGDDQNLWDRITAWWAEFTLQTKLLAIATLVVSLMMSGITFFALNGIQRDAVMNDTRYARDLGLLLAGNVTELVAQGQDRELANVAEKFWRSSRSVRYIFFADPEGVVYLGIPISGTPAVAMESFVSTDDWSCPRSCVDAPRIPWCGNTSRPREPSPMCSSP